jgi:hypothetical protein
MNDWESIIREYLAGLAGMTERFGQRIYAGRNLPPGYLPSQGEAILFATRGGGMDFSSQVLLPSVQFRIYAETEAKARQAAFDLHDAINDTQARKIAYARMEEGTMPTLLNEPESNWPYMLSFYHFQIRG